MSILNDIEIKRLCQNRDHLMIDPFVDRNVCDIDGESVISFGLGGFGYDIRLAPEYRIFHNTHQALIDVKNFDADKMLIDVKGDFIDIPPGTTVLGRSVEYFKIPEDVIAVCLGKSTYARAGVHVLMTPLEPEWEGQLVLEISNLTNCFNRVYAHEGIAQLLFYRGERPMVTYADKNGKYQRQTGITPGKV